MNKRKARHLDTLRTRRDELAARIAAEPDPARKAKAETRLAEIDARIDALSRRKFIPLPVILALIEAISLLIQWLQSTSS